MTAQDTPWFDDDAGPLVPAYAVTRGRTRSNSHELDMITLVITMSTGIGMTRAEPEYREILRLCGVPKSVAEISAAIRRPLAVTKVLIGDLINDGYVAYRSPQPMNADSADINLLRTVLDGIRAL
ncbi:DUF742 domain-containing protein [Nocardia harenae]|uniref:DUF742 domain-containing protein n=1 Tax=Nocardia harenae TaxID=358707 RepID=UPI0008349C2B|nr:DUF742 domain-containing protein [Nocardia harenae]